jgi:hypothetical protein
MRIALASLILAAGLAGAAQAQDQAAQPAPAAPAAQPAPPAQPAPAPAAPAAPTTAAPTTTAPTAAAPAPAAPAAPVAEAPPPPPELPTSGDGAVVLQVLERVCVPSVRGQKTDDLAKAMGMRLNRRDQTWSMALGGEKAYQIIVLPQGSNKDACLVEVHYAIGEDKPIVSALNIWSFRHDPELILQANYVNTDADGIKRVRKSWEALTANASTAVNFTVERKPDDTPLGRGYDVGKLYYQERKF